MQIIITFIFTRYWYINDRQRKGKGSKNNKSSAVAEMGDRGHNRHGLKRGGWCCAPFAERWEPV